jgi:hypothetical protein
MTEDLDDLTLVYIYGFKNGEQSMKAEIERLRAALREAREDILLRHNARGSEAAGTDEEAVSFIDAALAGAKTDDDAELNDQTWGRER